jgi:hypothetical protein
MFAMVHIFNKFPLCFNKYVIIYNFAVRGSMRKGECDLTSIVC